MKNRCKTDGGNVKEIWRIGGGKGTQKYDRRLAAFVAAGGSGSYAQILDALVRMHLHSPAMFPYSTQSSRHSLKKRLAFAHTM
jgi:hypothetical protein